MSTRTWIWHIRFLNPAFLGNAEQSGQWRTPPIKALLRQWWRVAYSADAGHSVDVQRMREAEGRLFGTVDGGALRSRVRLRLDRWDAGGLREWKALASIDHPYARHNDAPMRVGPDTYLGYGPITGGTASLKKAPAIDAGEQAMLSVMLDSTADPREVERLELAFTLMNLYGTLGGRSRNGWGSFALRKGSDEPPAAGIPPKCVRSFRDALSLDWPHALGRDARGALVWNCGQFSDWRKAMRRLAELRLGMRAQFRLSNTRSVPVPEDRHWLSYPIKQPSVQSWGRDLRIPNSLRLKLRPTDGGSIQAIAFHVPCIPPGTDGMPDRVGKVWEQVHAFLDDPSRGCARIEA